VILPSDDPEASLAAGEQHERLPRKNLLLGATIEAGALSAPVRIRNLSETGALIDGAALPDLEGEPGARAAELFLRFHVGAALFGTVQADPDPRDALLDAGGRLWILDFGASRRVVPERVALTAAALDALAADDGRRLGALLARLGWLKASTGHEALTLARAIAGPLLGADALLDAAALRAAGERALERRAALATLAVGGSLAPEDLWPLRMAAQLVAELATLGARADWLGLARTALRDGW